MGPPLARRRTRSSAQHGLLFSGAACRGGMDGATCVLLDARFNLPWADISLKTLCVERAAEGWRISAPARVAACILKPSRRIMADVPR